MKTVEIQEVVACLDAGRTLFHYFKDRYCFDLLEYEIEKRGVNAVSLGDIKKSHCGRFLQKETVKQAIGQLGHSRVTKEDLMLCRPTEQIPFTLSVARWGNGNRGGDQTTRNQSNLVLQLNFSNQHYQQMKKLVKPKNGERPFCYFGHPICRDNRDTLAWARMDISIESNEVLIEEIQNDWLRRAAWLVGYVEAQQRRDAEFQPGNTRFDIDCTQEELSQYVLQVLKPYQQIWSEAMLTATLHFIKRELGISNVYFHTFDTGNRLKAVPGEPPKSIYTKLPKQFGFTVVNDSPVFITRDKFARRCMKKIKQPKWYYLSI